MFMLVGNLFDNLRGTKLNILIGMEFTMAICLLILGLLERDYLQNQNHKSFILSKMQKFMMLMTECAASSIIIITLVQMFHWSPRKVIPQVMALWGFAQSVGYLIWINIDLVSDWIKYCVIASLFFLVAIIDIFTYIGHPAQVNIYVEDAQNSVREKELFNELHATVALRRSRSSETGINVFDLMENQQVKITFLMATSNKDIIVLILAGAFRIAGWAICQMTSNLYVELRRAIYRKTGIEGELLFRESCFILGVGLGGFLAVVLYHTCFQRKCYLLIVTLNSIMILWKVACNAFIYIDIEAVREWKTDPFLHLVE